VKKGRPSLANYSPTFEGRKVEMKDNHLSANQARSQATSVEKRGLSHLGFGNLKDIKRQYSINDRPSKTIVPHIDEEKDISYHAMREKRESFPSKAIKSNLGKGEIELKKGNMSEDSDCSGLQESIVYENKKDTHLATLLGLPSPMIPKDTSILPDQFQHSKIYHPNLKSIMAGKRRLTENTTMSRS
jgi:hypothetical protein